METELQGAFPAAAVLPTLFSTTAFAPLEQADFGTTHRAQGQVMQQEVLLAVLVLLAAAALFLAFRLWKKDQRRRVDPWAGSELEGLFKTKNAQTQRVDPGVENEFNRIFMATHKDGKEALIKHWTDKGFSRRRAMQSAIEEWKRDNR